MQTTISEINMSNKRAEHKSRERFLSSFWSFFYFICFEITLKNIALGKKWVPCSTEWILLVGTSGNESTLELFISTYSNCNSTQSSALKSKKNIISDNFLLSVTFVHSIQTNSAETYQINFRSYKIISLWESFVEISSIIQYI